jgi:hypothetical protein
MNRLGHRVRCRSSLRASSLTGGSVAAVTSTWEQQQQAMAEANDGVRAALEAIRELKLQVKAADVGHLLHQLQAESGVQPSSRSKQRSDARRMQETPSQLSQDWYTAFRSYRAIVERMILLRDNWPHLVTLEDHHGSSYERRPILAMRLYNRAVSNPNLSPSPCTQRPSRCPVCTPGRR